MKRKVIDIEVVDTSNIKEKSNPAEIAEVNRLDRLHDVKRQNCSACAKPSLVLAGQRHNTGICQEHFNMHPKVWKFTFQIAYSGSMKWPKKIAEVLKGEPEGSMTWLTVNEDPAITMEIEQGEWMVKIEYKMPDGYELKPEAYRLLSEAIPLEGQMWWTARTEVGMGRVDEFVEFMRFIVCNRENWIAVKEAA